MYDINHPTFTYAGALKPVREKSNTIRTIALLLAAGLLVAGILL